MIYANQTLSIIKVTDISEIHVYISGDMHLITFGIDGKVKSITEYKKIQTINY